MSRTLFSLAGFQVITIGRFCVIAEDSGGKVLMESILETRAATILQFFAGLRGRLVVTFEEGTWVAWLYDLLKPHAAQLVVCNPRKNFVMREEKGPPLPKWAHIADRESSR